MDNIFNLIENGNLSEVKDWVNNGGNINLTHEENSLLHFSAMYRRYNIVHYLLEQGANFNTKNNDGQTLLDLLIPSSRYCLNSICFIFNHTDNLDLNFWLSKFLEYDEVAETLLNKGANANHIFMI